MLFLVHLCPASCLCLLPLPLPCGSALWLCLCLVPLPRASASCLVPGVYVRRTSAPNRVVRHELKTTAQCGATLPTATRANNDGKGAPRSGENPG